MASPELAYSLCLHNCEGGGGYNTQWIVLCSPTLWWKDFPENHGKNMAMKRASGSRLKHIKVSQSFASINCSGMFILHLYCCYFNDRFFSPMLLLIVPYYSYSFYNNQSRHSSLTIFLDGLIKNRSLVKGDIYSAY